MVSESEAKHFVDLLDKYVRCFKRVFVAELRKYDPKAYELYFHSDSKAIVSSTMRKMREAFQSSKPSGTVPFELNALFYFWQVVEDLYAALYHRADSNPEHKIERICEKLRAHEALWCKSYHSILIEKSANKDGIFSFFYYDTLDRLWIELRNATETIYEWRKQYKPLPLPPPLKPSTP